jgi:hypothetical protein
VDLDGMDEEKYRFIPNNPNNPKENMNIIKKWFNPKVVFRGFKKSWF